jgi:methylated-DNA-[protein]-cysteine S-methyltransferase
MNACRYTSPIGNIILLSDTTSLLGLWFAEDSVNEFLEDRGYDDIKLFTDPILKRSMFQLDEYFSGKRKDFDLPLSYSTTNFRDKAWKSLLKIPYGETRSYLDQARSIGNAKASRAVGQANHHNPISIVIPCHRVVSSCGKLTGYASGIDKKQWLLDHEQNVSITS